MVCRFDAIDEMMCIIPLNCEGCGACGIVCPVQAIHLEPVITGQVFLDNTKSGPFAHALLAVGAEGSGKLVTEVRQLGEEHRTGEHWTIIDGSPGIGCVVIASMTGCDGVLAVVEPTLTGLSDLKRVLAVADHFCVPSFVCTNRYDINRDISRQIVIFCLQNGYHWVGQIPYDHRVMEIQKGNGSLVDSDSLAAKAMKDVWFKTKARMMTGRGSRS
jgi:MinD superfamily P-loop ATPase